MAVYRYFAHDLRTNAALAELPLSSLTYTETLNGPGSWSATCPLLGNAVLLNAATEPERTAIYIERDGAIVGGGIVWTRTRSMDQPMTLGGAGWWSFFKRQNLRSTLTFAATDQLLIARTLINTAQAQPGANIGVTVGAEVSGIARDRVYNSFECKQIAEAVEQLADVQTGFDFAIDTTQARGKVLALSYPRRGRISGSTGIVFETGKNLIGYTATQDGTRSARTFTAIGAGDGVDMLIATNTRTDLLDAGFPLTSDTGSFKDVIVQATLDGHALAGVNARAVTPTFWSIVVDPDDPDGGIKSFITGDDAVLRIGDDVNFPRQADGSPGYERAHRILEWSLNVPESGKDTLGVTLGTI
jgi:hypothetical protein